MRWLKSSKNEIRNWSDIKKPPRKCSLLIYLYDLFRRGQGGGGDEWIWMDNDVNWIALDKCFVISHFLFKLTFLKFYTREK